MYNSMGISSFRPFPDRSITENDLHISHTQNNTKPKLPPEMAAANMDILQHDDHMHDLMGLQELDSVFENLGRESSTPSATWSAGFDDTVDTIEDSSNTIIVDSPIEEYQRQLHHIPGSRARLGDRKSKSNSISQYVLTQTHSLINTIASVLRL